MIISERVDKEHSDFEKLLDYSCAAIEQESIKDPSYFLKRTSNEFEWDVYDALCQCAKGTDFESTIQLISGHKFPDIVIKRFYGVEVKTSKQTQWKSIGNSVLETTRVEDVNRIYIFFGKLSTPVGFKYRRYEECLYDVAVTHSPRYLIDMELKNGQSIFEKLKLPYDTLRGLPNSIKPFIDYYRSIAKEGEEPWWMDSGDSTENVFKPTVTIWSNLDRHEQRNFRNEAIARFPEIFGNSSAKYQRLAAWLAARHGVVDSSLRDRFTAGGKVDLDVAGVLYRRLPKIFQYLKDNCSQIIELVKNLPPEDAKYHWDLKKEPADCDKIDIWTEKLIEYASEILSSGSRPFIIHLLGSSFSQNEMPCSVKEEMAKYGLE